MQSEVVDIYETDFKKLDNIFENLIFMINLRYLWINLLINILKDYKKFIDILWGNGI